MPDYQKMYVILLDATERAIELLEQKRQSAEVIALLCKAEQTCEELYIGQ